MNAAMSNCCVHPRTLGISSSGTRTLNVRYNSLCCCSGDGSRDLKEGGGGGIL